MTLHLTLKKKWFDLIAAGEKKEEYREIKPFWINRLMIEFIATHDEDGRVYRFEPKMFKRVIFKNGYSKKSPTITLKIRGISVGPGKQKWGAEPGQHYFVISLGEIIK